MRTAGLAGLLLGAPLLVGSVHAWTAGLIAAGSVLFFALIVAHTQARRRRVEVPWLAAVALGLTVATVLQLLPLPKALLGLIAPASRDLYTVMLADAPAAVRAAWRAVSLDRSATALELVKLSGLCALLLAMANTHRRSSSRQQLTLWLVISGGVVALLGLLGLALGTHGFLGLYSPRGSWDPLVAHGPFVNPNHLAGLMGLTAMCAFGLAGCPQQPRGRSVFAVCVGGLCLGALVLSGSRGALVAALASAPLLALLLLRARRGQGAGRLALGALLVLAVAAGFAFGRLGTTLREAGDPVALREDRKLKAFAGALDHIRANPWVGTGRGAFARAHTRYKRLPDNLRFTHVENEPLQAAADWGVPLGLVVVGAGVWLLVRLLRRKTLDPLQAGQTCGLVFLGLHNMVDFNLETLGVAVPAVVVLGMLTTQPRRRPRVGARGKSAGRRRRERAARPRGLRSLRAWAVPAGLVLALVASAPLVEEDALGRLTEPLRRHATAARLDRARWDADLAAALDRAPAEYLVPLLAARGLAPKGVPRPGVEPSTVLRWVNRAMYLNPTAPGPHLQAARLLWATGHQRQALGEYRLAGRRGAPPRALVHELVRRRVRIEHLLETTPPTGPALIALARALLARGRTTDADQALARLADVPRWRVPALRLRARTALEHAPPAEALVHAQALAALRGDEGEAQWLLGRALQRAGREEDAMRAWATATKAAPQLDRAWQARLAALARRGDWLALAELLAEFEPQSRRSPRARGRYLTWKARLQRRHERFEQAIRLYRDALAADPRAVGPAPELATLLEGLGDLRGAEAALTLALERGGPASLAQRREALRARIGAAP